MAASVLLGSADNTGLNFAAGGGGSSGRAGNAVAGHNNGLGSAGPAPWNRSLDRALDEASATGCLNLSGRKLKEFPRSAANHDLTDTTRAGELAAAGAAHREPGWCPSCRLGSLYDSFGDFGAAESEYPTLGGDGKTGIGVRTGVMAKMVPPSKHSPL